LGDSFKNHHPMRGRQVNFTSEGAVSDYLSSTLTQTVNARKIQAQLLWWTLTFAPKLYGKAGRETVT